MERTKTNGIVKARYMAGSTNSTVPIVSICPSVSMDNAPECSAEIGCTQFDNTTFGLGFRIRKTEHKRSLHAVQQVRNRRQAASWPQAQ
jgi:hypothetical protein